MITKTIYYNIIRAIKSLLYTAANQYSLSDIHTLFSIKGQCHEIDILISTFCVCADGLKVFQSFSLPNPII
jgi:hypothetical protein